MLDILQQPQILAFLGLVALAGYFLLGTHGLFVVMVGTVLFYLGFHLYAGIELTSSTSILGFLAVVVAVELVHRLLTAISPRASGLVDTLGYWLVLIIALVLVTMLISNLMGYEPTFLNNLIGV